MNLQAAEEVAEVSQTAGTKISLDVAGEGVLSK
jgi:hypothetical protein